MYNRLKNSSQLDCAKQIELINTFRKLWEQHIMWTRSFIISTAENLCDLELVTKRLLRNPLDFEKVLSKYYGMEKAKMFSDLFTEHLAIAATLVNQAKQGDIAAVEITRRKWYQNADEIAEFLSSINPHWKKKTWQNMLYSHLKMTEDLATYRLKGMYAQDIEIYDNIETQALEMADYMAMGIMKQIYM